MNDKLKCKLKYKLNASITVEAAFAFTITIFVLFLMLGPLLIIKTSSDILVKLNNASKLRCNYETIKYWLNDTEIYKNIEEKIKDSEFLNSNLKGIENIVNFANMIFDFSDEYDESKSEYRNIDYVYNKNKAVYDEDTAEVLYDFVFGFSLPYNFFNVSDVKKRLVNNRRAFMGSVGDRFAQKEESGDFVYVANNHIYSNRYHLFIDCTYLEKNTEKVLYENMKNMRNDNNAKYYKCNYCFKNVDINSDTICFITQYGEKYHYNDNCPLMTAYVSKLSRNIAEKYEMILCSRCNKREIK